MITNGQQNPNCSDGRDGKNNVLAGNDDGQEARCDNVRSPVTSVKCDKTPRRLAQIHGREGGRRCLKLSTFSPLFRSHRVIDAYDCVCVDAQRYRYSSVSNGFNSVNRFERDRENGIPTVQREGNVSKSSKILKNRLRVFGDHWRI